MNRVPFLALFCILVPASWADGDKDKPLELSKAEKTLLSLTNKERAKEKLPPLEPNARLFKMARKHSANMAKQEKMDHVLDGKSHVDRAKKVGYQFSSLAENVAWSTGDSLKEIMKGWMKSPGHRANIMNKEYREIGLGMATNDKGENYYTQVFGRSFPRK